MILSIIAIVVAIFLIYGFYKASQLKNIHIQKKVSITSDIEAVYDKIRYLEKFPEWSPFYDADPEQKYEVKGTDGAVGAQFHWDGNKGKDLGYQEIVKLSAPTYVGMKCDIQKPFKASPTFEYALSSNGNDVTVTQDFKLESGLVDSFFMWLFGARKQMEKTNEHGMNLLKKAVEG